MSLTNLIKAAVQNGPNFSNDILSICIAEQAHFMFQRRLGRDKSQKGHLGGFVPQTKQSTLHDGPLMGMASILETEKQRFSIVAESPSLRNELEK